MNQNVSDDIIIKVEDLTIAYEDKPVLWDVELGIKKGILMAIVGPNGAGKSTLIKAMLDLIKPITGEVRFYDEKYSKVRDRIAYVPQRGSVDWDFPTTVFDVVEMGRYGKVGWLKKVRKIDKEKTKEAIHKVEMDEFSDRQISQLSGGQQQRVSIARTLFQEATIILADEPVASLDPVTSKKILSDLKDINEQLGITVIVNIHSVELAKAFATKIIALQDGKLVFEGTPEELTDEKLNYIYKGISNLEEEVQDED